MPPAARSRREREVVQAGDAWCQSRGSVCVLEDAHVEGQARWVLRTASTARAARVA